MNTANRQMGFAQRLGRGAGRVVRRLRRGEQHLENGLVSRGLSAGAAKALLWVIKLAVLGVLLYAAFWLALLVVCAVAAAWAVEHADEEGDSDFLGRKAEERDHREGIFYHPASYNDDPDPRFKDD